MQSFEKLLDQNKQRTAHKKVQDPQFLKYLSYGQKPEFSWGSYSVGRVSGEHYIQQNNGSQVIPWGRVTVFFNTKR